MRSESLQDLLSLFPDFDGFWSKPDATVAESLIRDNLSRSTDAFKDSLKARIHLVRSLDLQGRSQEARALLDLVRGELSSSSEVIPAEIELLLLIEEGRHYSLAMTPSKAMNFLSRAWTMATQAKEDRFSVEAALLLSFVQPRRSQNEWLRQAMQLAEASSCNESELWLSHIYTMAGWHAFDFRKFDEAIQYFEKALARPRLKGESSNVSALRWSVARTLREQKKVDQALEILRALHSDLKESSMENGHVFLEMAECFRLSGQKDEAKEYFEKAHGALSLNQWYVDNRNTELSRMQEIFKKRY